MSEQIYYSSAESQSAGKMIINEGVSGSVGNSFVLTNEGGGRFVYGGIPNGSVSSFPAYTAEESTSVFTLAKAFLNIAPMTHKKLQKLCYYAKAWYLALYDTNLIAEDFEAWVHGAVQPALYQQYRCYGFQTIPQVSSLLGVPEEFISFAREVYDSYGDLTGDELEILNHSEDPWIKARAGAKPWERCSNIILEEDMKAFYRSRI
ncbi:Uncharacterized phage-associated protein [uncultured Collinsella sp.]|nr:Uncharacterized phage-associated protein [uncultured Collinsella sp.]